jgi:hypothetical protein
MTCWAICLAGVFAIGPTLAEARVPDNRVLTCTGISLDHYDVCAGVAVKLYANATDPNGKRLTYRWETTGGKIVAHGSKATLLTDGLKPGKYTVKAEVSDGFNPSVDCSVDITIIESTPPN